MLEVNDLKVAYRSRTIIEKLTLSPIAPGQLVSLLGPNGTGKSTLLKAMAGLLPPRHGTVRLDGTDLASLDFRERARHVVYLPQSLPFIMQTVWSGDKTPLNFLINLILSTLLDTS